MRQKSKVNNNGFIDENEISNRHAAIWLGTPRGLDERLAGEDHSSRRASFVGLSNKFRDSAAWHGPVEDLKGDEAVAMLRLPNEEPDPSESKVVIALNRRTTTEPASEISPEVMERFWESCLNRLQPTALDWLKAGGTMWDHLKLELAPEWTAELLGLEKVDADIERASQAALFGALATRVSPVDLDTVLYALGIFIHTHPFFADAVRKGVWHLPYGEDTVYTVTKRRMR
ncbi:hypothetical protein E3H11_10550 [Bradyrhizobium brasilense]|uniref:hypothetical protein n=1 Tax=Bradyrhizobium brasilense TaxID=1419277 RepID=UPI001456E74A|nr:hypothetical protein [Bradyrhizobium brasilense]NLS69351.1 hypothetical protein [Bradyrhizobium brasilense]